MLLVKKQCFVAAFKFPFSLKHSLSYQAECFSSHASSCPTDESNSISFGLWCTLTHWNEAPLYVKMYRAGNKTAPTVVLSCVNREGQRNGSGLQAFQCLKCNLSPPPPSSLQVLLWKVIERENVSHGDDSERGKGKVCIYATKQLLQVPALGIWVALRYRGDKPFSYVIVCPLEWHRLDTRNTIATTFQLPFIRTLKLLCGKTYIKRSTNITLGIQHTCSCLFIERVERGTVWFHGGLFLQLLLLNHTQDRIYVQQLLMLPRRWTGFDFLYFVVYVKNY